MNTQWNAEVVTPVEEGAGTKVLDNQSNVQPTLEAGSNITIANGEISASGGGAEYTAGSGISIDDNNTISVDSDIRSGAAAGATAVQAADLATVATSGSYDDLSNKPTIPAAQVNSDWNAASGVAQILNKPTLATVATSGSYADLSNKPTIPTVDQVYDNTSANAQSGVAVASAISGKQDTISDLSTIRSGAEAGATAVQPSDLATVATSGSYADLSNKPTIPTVAQSYNALSTDAMSGTAVAEAISGTGQVPSVTSTDNGKVLKATYEGGVGSFGWDAAPSGVPSTTSSDEGKVLGVTDNQGSLGWVAQTPSQVNADWNSSSGVSEILNKPTLATVATSGSYADLSNKPTIPTVDQSYSASSTNAQSGTAVADALSNINQVPASTSADEDKVLTVDSNGDAVWAAAQTGPDITVDTTNNDIDFDGDIVLHYTVTSGGVGSTLVYANTSYSGNYVYGKFQKNDGTAFNPSEVTIVVSGSIWYSGGAYSMVVKDDQGNALTQTPALVDSTMGYTAAGTYKLTTSTTSTEYLSVEINTMGTMSSSSAGMIQGDIGGKMTVTSAATPLTADLMPNVSRSSADNGKVLGVTDTSGTLGWVAQTPAQVNADWNAASGVSQIMNKPSLATVATSGSYNDLSNKPSIPAAQVNSDWDAVSGISQILNKPSLATVATSGSYDDLTNKPSIPAAQVNADWDAVSGVSQILNKPTLATVATSGSYADLSNKPTVDQSYSASSTNAQSGVAVANAISAVKQVPSSTSTDEGKVLTVNSSGNAVWDAAPETVTIGYKEI